MTSRAETARRPARAKTTFTTRGSSVLAAALAAALGAFALGETDLLRVAIVIIVVCLLSWLVEFGLRARIRSGFRPEPAEAPVDSTIQVRVQTRLTRAMMPTSVLCHSRVSEGLSSTSHLAVPGHRLRTGLRLDFDTRVNARGLHTLGPLEVRLRDPLGLITTNYLGSQQTQVLGVPRWHEVHPGWLRSIGMLPLASGTAAEEGLAGEPDVVVREHRPEDGLRRVHWRTSARTGRLMTRLDHPEADRVAMLIFETRTEKHRHNTFEDTLELVASLGLALLHGGWDLRLVDSTGERRAPAGGWDRAGLMRFLALAEPAEAASAPGLPIDRTPVLLITTDPAQHEPRAIAQTFLVPLPASAPPAPAPGLATLSAGQSVADLLATDPARAAA